jgi:GNAT superfamily N-acetyltransferase
VLTGHTMTLDVTVSEADEKEFAEFLHAQIREYNNRQSHHHRQARQPGAVKPLHVMLKNKAGRVIGGLAAHTYWDWLEIDDFFVPDDLRGKGIGTTLLQTAETIAVRRGVSKCFLSTFEFQAQAFYEKRGYSVVGKLEGYPPGSTFFWMRKDLALGQNTRAE